MSVTTVHDFRRSFEWNTVTNAERFMAAGEPLRADLLSQVKVAHRQNLIRIEALQDEIAEQKANLEHQLQTSRPEKVREWDSVRKSRHEREIIPRERQITAFQEQNQRFQKCLDFHNKESKRREKAELDKQTKEYPKRIKALSQATTGADKAIIKAVYALAKVLGDQSLFQAVSDLVELPRKIKRLENDRIVLESHGITCDEIPDELYAAIKDTEALRKATEAIVGRPYQDTKRGPSSTKRLALSRAREQKAEMEAKRREGIQ